MPQINAKLSHLEGRRAYSRLYAHLPVRRWSFTGVTKRARRPPLLKERFGENPQTASTNMRLREIVGWRCQARGYFRHSSVSALVTAIMYSRKHIVTDFHLEQSTYIHIIFDLTAGVYFYFLNILYQKIHFSCEIEDCVETHRCKLCAVLRSSVLRVVCVDPH